MKNSLALLLLAVIAGLGCRAASAEDDLLWTGPAVNDWQEAKSLDVHGVMEQGAFRPTAVHIHREDNASPAALLALGTNILPLAKWRAFGVEERVEARASGGPVKIMCRAGRAPAGLTLRWPDRRFPAGFHGKLRLTGTSDVPMGIALIAEGQDAPASADGKWTGGPIAIPLPERPERHVLVITCPTEGGSAQIDRLAIEPTDDRPPVTARGTWVWDERAWGSDPASFADAAASAGWTELAIQAPAAPGMALALLARALKGHSITLRLLDGDPAMATAEGLKRALPRLDRLRRWCEDHLGDQSLPMLELDIEPYGSPAFATDPASGWRGWTAAVRALATAWGQPVAVDVPWWMRGSPGGEGALTEAVASVAELVVMAYRTDPQLILDAVEPWLAPGSPAVRVAIETGPVSPEVTRRYRRSAHGTLRVSDAGTALLARARPATPGEAMFELAGEDVTDPTRVSFHHSPLAAVRTEKRLVRLLAGWRSFAGFRIHGWSAADRR